MHFEVKVKTNKKLDRSQKSKIRWVLGYRSMAYHLITHGDKQVWQNLVDMSDSLPSAPFPIITDALRWALNKEKNEQQSNTRSN